MTPEDIDGRRRTSPWSSFVIPRVTHRVLATPPIDAVRQHVLADTSGDVVEIGFGSGLSLAHYPAAVTKVLAIDPDDTGWKLSAAAREVAEARHLVVERSGRDAQSLPFPNASVSTVVTFWTLCTVPDLNAALDEIARVLRPGGVFAFAEHGPSSRARRRRVESLVEPLWRPLAGGCHLTREPWLGLPARGFSELEVTRPAQAQGLPPGTRIGRAIKVTSS